VKGVVRNLTNYGAFVELEQGIDGLLHVSDMSWTRKIGHPNELIEKGQEIECQVLAVDQDKKRIALGLKQLRKDPWETDIPSRYQPGDMVKGKVTKLTNFGVFVELEPGLEGLLHISELADHKVENPEDMPNADKDDAVIVAVSRDGGIFLVRRAGVDSHVAAADALHQRLMFGSAQGARVAHFDDEFFNRAWRLLQFSRAPMLIGAFVFQIEWGWHGYRHI